MATLEWRSETNDMAVQQFDVAAKKLGVDPNLASRLCRPDRAMIVSVPTRMDDGRVHVFIGYRVTFAGSFIGAAYGFVAGYVSGLFVAWVYNAIVVRRSAAR